VIFNPPSIPINAEVIVKMRGMIMDEEVKRTIGAIFCQVRRVVAWAQLINSITCGNQRWVGAIPAFAAIAIKIIFWA
jgi:hypothetical protein